MNPPRQRTDRDGCKMILFVAGDEPNSVRARRNLTRFCEEELESPYDVEVVDVLEDHRPAMTHNIMLVPALVVTGPPPLVILGDLSNKEKLLKALGIPLKQPMHHGK
jgi:circadian clock protein KaiB